MAGKKKDAMVPILPGVTAASAGEVDMKSLRRDTLIAGGLLTPRPEKKYKTEAEKKEARSIRGKARRATRRSFLEEKGLVSPKVKMSKEEKKDRSKARRSSFNAFLRGNPEEAARLGIDPKRRKV